MSLFIIGSGACVGAGIARKFQSQGYKVALGSRSPNVEKLVSQGFLLITVDASSVQSIEAAFAEVSEKFGGAPSVVVYNAVSVNSFPDPKDAFAVPTTDFIQDAQVNIIGFYAALHSTLSGFKSITDPNISKVFIATGNILPFKPVPFGTGFVTGKAAQAHLITIGTLSYQSQGYRFYFASQVTSEGEPVQYDELSGEAHGNAYWDIVQRDEQGSWQVNFGPDAMEYGKLV